MRRFGRWVLASVLTIVQFTLMAGLAIGVPAMSAFMAWSTQNQLSPGLDDLGLGKEADEVLIYLILHTVLLTLLIWGTVPVLAVSRVSSSRAKLFAYVAFGGTVAVLVATAIRTTYLAWNWVRVFELADGDAKLVARCKLISLTVGILFCVGATSVMICSSYVLQFGMPSVIRRMLDDAAQLLVPSKVRSGTTGVGNMDEKKSKSIEARGELDKDLNFRARG